MLNKTFIRQTGTLRWLARTALRQFDKQVLKRDSTMRLPTGRMIILPRQSSNASEVFVTKANCDLGSEGLFVRFANASRDLLDVGGHIGYYSLYLSPCVRHVYAFEPDSRNFAGLRANIAQGGNITHIAKAVSARSGNICLAVDGDTAISHVNDRGTEVEATSIDDFVRESGAKPGLIKIDVEGHDLAVLQGAIETIKAEQPLILTEFSLAAGVANDPDRLFDLLADINYRAFAYIWRTDRIVFEEVTLETVRDIGIKMLFLVPQQHHAAFAAMVQKRTQ